MTKTYQTHTYRSVRASTVAAGLLLTMAIVAAEDIYKSTDAQGRPVYSDRPLSSTAERVTIQSRPRDAAAAEERARQELAELVRRQEERDRQTAASRAAKQEKETAEKAQAERCIAARNRYFTFAEGNRLYRRDEAGNRVYYTGAEIDAERVAAKNKMDQECAGQR